MNYSFTTGLFLQGIYFLKAFSGDIFPGDFFRGTFFWGTFFQGFLGAFSCSRSRYLFIFKEALYGTKRGSYLHCFNIF